MNEPPTRTVVGRYELHAPIARGGMATIHLARLHGAEGFCRIVAAKRLHPHLLEDEQFLEMFLDEARIASKIHHPNVVPVLDVLQTGTEVILIQEYVHGVPLDKLLRAMNRENTLLPVEVVVAIISGVLAGLCAAHEAKDELGVPLQIVHRDVSPQNVLVGVDGTARLLDFGVAKAAHNAHVTRAGVFKGKIAYSAPEMLAGRVTPSIDLHATAVVCWEALACRRLHVGLTEVEMIAAISAGAFEQLTSAIDADSVSPERWKQLMRIDPVLSRAMEMDPEDRYASAAEMQSALLDAAPAAPPTEVARWVKQLGREYLEGREKLIATEESSFRRRRASATSTPLSEPGIETGPISATQASEPAPSIQASVLSSASPQPPRQQWAIVGALLVVGGLLAGILVILMHRPIARASAVAGPDAASDALPISAPLPDAAPPIGSASAAAPSDAGPASSALAPRLPHRPRWPVLPATPAVQPAADCNPPFTFDGKKKVFKPGCL